MIPLYDKEFFLKIWDILDSHKVGSVNNWHRPEWNWQLSTQTTVIWNVSSLASDLENEMFDKQGQGKAQPPIMDSFYALYSKNHEE
jgi:hypothetical protein